MAADHRLVRASPARHVEPRQMAGGSLGRLAFGAEFHDAFGRAEAQACQGVDDHAQAVVPAVRARAVEVREEFPVPGSAQFRLDLSRERLRGGDVPLRQQARVNQHLIRLDVNHRPVTQPVEELVAIWCREHFCERVVFAFLDNAVCEREQVQIVVAEDRQRALAQITHETQRGKRCRAPVDEIAYEPQAVLVAVESARAEQHPQLLEAALDVADRVDGHFGSVPVKQVPGPVPEAWLGSYRSNRLIPVDFLELPADQAIERIAPTPADQIGDTRERQQQSELVAARGPEKPVFKLDAKGDHGHLDCKRKRHLARKKPEREQDHAEEFEAPYRPSPEEGRFHSELQNVPGGDAVHAALEYLFVTRRNDDHGKHRPRESISKGREPPVQPSEPGDDEPVFVNCTRLVDHGFLLSSEFPSDRAIERMMPAAAEKKRETQTQEEQGILNATAVPQPAFVDVHAEDKNKQLDYKEQGDRARQEPENQQRAAEKFEHADAVGPGKRRRPSGERFAGERRRASGEKLLRAVRDENRAGAYTQERVAVRRERLM